MTETIEPKINKPLKEKNRLLQMDRLNEGDMLVSTNSAYYAVMRNGSLNVYKTQNFNRRNITWSSNTDMSNLKRPFSLYINFEGNLTISDSDKKIVWQSNNSDWKGVPTYYLIMQGR